MSNMKDGKVALSDRDKYRQMSTHTGDVLSIPKLLSEAFEEAGLAAKWVSKAKIAGNGGYHPSNWIPYEISSAQKSELPKAYTGSIVNNHLERGDLVLAVKPKELQDAHKKEIRRKTKQQLDSFYQETDAEGRTILERPE